MAACAVLPVYALLLNTSILLKTDILTERTSGTYPAAYPGERANVTVTVVVPAVIFNSTALGRGTYRLEVKVEAKDAAVGWSSVKLNPAALFRPLTEARYENFGTVAYVADFDLGNTSVLLKDQENSFAFQLTLSYMDYASHGLTLLNTSATLTPWAWHNWDFADSYDWETALFGGAANVSSNYRNYGLILANLTWPDNCSLVDSSFTAPKSWANVSTCARCVFQVNLLAKRTFSSVTLVNLDPQPCGVVPNYTSFTNVSFEGPRLAVSAPTYFLPSNDSTPELYLGQRANFSYLLNLPIQIRTDPRLRLLTYNLKMTATLSAAFSVPKYDVRLEYGSFIRPLRPLSTTMLGSQIKADLNLTIDPQATTGGNVSLTLDVAFTNDSVPGSYAYETKFELVPWNWLYWSLNDTDYWEQNVSAAHTNLSQYVTWGAISSAGTVLPRQCSFVAPDFSSVSSWSQVSSCSRCVYYEQSRAVTFSMSTTVVLRGPLLAVTSTTAPPTLLEAGDKFSWIISIGHSSPDSTTDAVDVEVVIQVHRLLILNVSSVAASGGSNGSSNVSVNSGRITVFVPLLSLENDSITIRASLSLPDDMPILLGATGYSSIISVRYAGVTPGGARVIYKVSGSVDTDVKGLRMINQETQNPSPWRHNELGKVHFNISVPFGKVSNFFMKIQFLPLLSIGNAVRPLNFTITSRNTDLILDGPGLTIGGDSLNVQTYFDQYLDISSPSYTIHNFPNGTSPAYMALDLTYALHPNAAKSTRLEMLTYVSADGMYWTNQSSSVVAGPVLSPIAAIEPNQNVQAGDRLRWSVIVQHDVLSDEGASDVQVIIALGSYLGGMTFTGINTAQYERSSGRADDINLIFRSIMLNERIIINGSAEVNSTLPITTIGTVCLLYVNASYRSFPEGTILYTSVVAQTRAKGSSVTWQPLLPLWTPGLQATVLANLSMPRGTIGNAAAVLEIYDALGSRVPVQFLSKTVSSSSSFLRFTALPDTISVVESNLTVAMSVSELVNPVGAPSPATLSFSVTYLLLGNATIGRRINSRISWSLQPETTAVIDSRMTTIAGPALAGDCSLTPSVNVKAGDIMNWTCVVQHASGSTSMASNIEIAVELSRYWTGVVASVTASGINNTNLRNFTTVNSSAVMTRVATFGLTDQPIVIRGQARVSDLLPITITSSTTRLLVKVTYIGIGLQATPYTVSSSVTATSKALVITSSPSTALCPYPSWLIGQPATTTTNLDVPKGTLEAYITYEVAATGGASVPLRVLSPVVNGSSDNISISYGASPGSTGKRRRSVSTSVTSFSSIPVTIVVPGAISASTVSITFKTTFFTLGTASPQAAIGFTSKLVVGGNPIILGNTTTKILAPALTMIKTSELQTGSSEVQTVRYKIALSHDASSSYDAAAIVVSDSAKGMVILNDFKATPNTSTTGFPDDDQLLWQIDLLPLGQNAVFWYLAQPAGDKGRDLPAGSTIQTCSLTYSMDVAQAVEKPSFLVASSTCVSRTSVTIATYFSEHGYTFLLAAVGVLVGVGLVAALTVASVVIMKRRFPHAYERSIEPRPASQMDFETFKLKAREAFTNMGKALRRGFDSIQDISQMVLEDSIVLILALRNKLLISRELDCLDIKAAVRADRQLEKSRLEALLSSLEALLRGMLHNRDVAKRVYDDGRAKLRSSVEQGSKALDGEYERLLNNVVKALVAKSKKAVDEITKKHKARKDQTLEKAGDRKSKEVRGILEVIDSECQSEIEEQLCINKLQQEEEAEKLRRELTLRKRIQLKELQQQLIQYVIAESKLAPEQAQWLIKQHKENQAKIETMYDDRLLQVKLMLEEKLAKRRLLAEINQVENEAHTDLLNEVASGQIDMLRRAKKAGVLTPDELRGMTEDAMSRMAATKEAWERERARQEHDLHQRLCQLKKKQLEAKEKENQIQTDALSEQQRQRTKLEPVDPVLLETEKLGLLAEHDSIMMELESKIDEDNKEELRRLQESLAIKAKAELQQQENQLAASLKKEGMADQQVQAILAEHKQAVDRLREMQQAQHDKFEDELQGRLQQRRREWQKSMEDERADQAMLRDQEDQVVQELMGKQIAMSDEDRERVIREHEKNMARLENNLTFGRLQQRRILEEKLAQRRAVKLEKLEQQQLLEQRKTQSRHRNETDDERQVAEMELLKKQAEERLEMIQQTDDISLEEEMEKVKLEMIAERAKQLREQEDHIGSLMVSLQLAKAKELAEIEEKQRAINSLTTNLMEDLTDRGILSDPECQRVIEKHQMDQEKLTRKLDEERDKQERMLKSKMALKLQQREKSMVVLHEEKIRSIMKGTKGGTAVLLRKAAMMARNKAELEDFRIRMEKEVSQTLEDLRLQQMTRKRRLVQELEMRFVAGLIKLGKLKRTELAECLRLLFPAKTAPELDQLISSLIDESATAADADTQASGSEEDLLSSSSASMLKDRIQRAVRASYSSLQTVKEEDSGLQAESTETKRRSTRKKKPMKQIPAPVPAESDEEILVPVSQNLKHKSDSGALELTSSRNKRLAPPRTSEKESDRFPGSGGDTRQQKALPPLKLMQQSRRLGPNSDMDHLT